jgi:uncharacterized membrane protein
MNGKTAAQSLVQGGNGALISLKIWTLRQAFRKVWVRVFAFAILAALSAIFAKVVSPYLPNDFTLKAGADAVNQILGVLASSMLAVTTFSLSIAVSALTAASGTATPRTTALLQTDPTTQNVLATFLGAFLFSLIGLIALNARIYDESGRIVLFFVTIAVVLLVIVTLIRWIDHLMKFGRMNNTLDRVEQAAEAALKSRLKSPFLGGNPLSGLPPASAVAVPSCQTGYVRYVDAGVLQACAEEMKAKVYLNRLPGGFVTVRGPLLMVDGAEPDEGHIDRLRSAFSIDHERLFDEDPRFGLIVLSEIASRALSPAVNDPGTAISVLTRLVRILAIWEDDFDAEVAYEDVYVPPITAAEVIEDAFRPIARDGAGMIEVQVRLQKSLADLAQASPGVFGARAMAMSRYALKRAEAGNLADSEMTLLRQLSDAVVPSRR